MQIVLRSVPSKAVLTRVLGLVLAAAFLTSVAGAAPPSGPNSWCATSPEKLLVSQAKHEFHQRYLARERLAGRLPQKSAPTILQEGQVAILDDDGTVTRPPMPFDFGDRALTYLPRPRGMNAVRSLLGMRQVIGDRIELGDDDSVFVPFPEGFQFPFGDGVYDGVWVNSNGLLTFTQPILPPIIDPGFLDFVAPAIAPLFADLDPSTSEGENGVYVYFLENRVRITWRGVAEWNTTNSSTFQVTLYTNGRVNFAYGDVDAAAPLVGLAPYAGTFNLFLFDYTEELPITARRGTIVQRFTSTPEMNEFGAIQAFTEHFQDVYTTVFLWLDFPAITPGFAFEVTLQNDIQGIGEDIFNFTNQVFPASRRLESFVQMGDMSRFPDDPDEVFLETASTMVVLGHEFGHRWLARVQFRDAQGEPSFDILNFPGGAHWNFFTNSEGSLMHGNAWEDNGDGSFSATTRAHSRFSPLDRYLMGLASPASVPDFFYIRNPDSTTSPGALPIFEGTVNGERVDVSIDDIRAVEGPRRPRPALAKRNFRTAFLLVSLVGEDPSPESLAKIENYRQRWETYFSEATNGRGVVKTRLFPR